MDGMSCGSLETVLMLSGPALWTSCAVISVTSLPVSANAVVDAVPTLAGQKTAVRLPARRMPADGALCWAW